MSEARGPYKPASFFLTTIVPPTGWAIWTGQFLAGRPSRYEHAGMIIDTDGLTVEAQPGGARYGHVDNYAHRGVLISDAPVTRRLEQLHRSNQPGAEALVRAYVVLKTRELLDVPYSALDYAALAALHLHLPSTWIRKRVETSGHLICSALCDRAYMNAGIHLFDDGRLPGDVMPSDLADWVYAHPEK